jgi:hypothetical protein
MRAGNYSLCSILQRTFDVLGGWSAPVFEKVISPKKTALWYQIDRRIDLLINLQLSAVIPMLNTGQ